MKLLLNIVGILLVLAISWLISWDRKSVKWKKGRCSPDNGTDHCNPCCEGTNWTEDHHSSVERADSSYQLWK